VTVWQRLIAAVKRAQRRSERRVVDLGPRFPVVALPPSCVSRQVSPGIALSPGCGPLRGEP
jgi:hypothetical protein